MNLNNPADVATLRQRLAAITPNAPAQWGKMRVDQMLHHVARSFDMALGTFPTGSRRPPIPRRLMLMIALRAPWPKGTPTAPELLSADSYDFDAERAECLALLDRVVAKPVEGEWPRHPIFGQMSGRDWKHLAARHTDHHLRQFNA